MHSNMLLQKYFFSPNSLRERVNDFHTHDAYTDAAFFRVAKRGNWLCTATAVVAPMRQSIALFRRPALLT